MNCEQVGSGRKWSWYLSRQTYWPDENDEKHEVGYWSPALMMNLKKLGERWVCPV
jgi:hypothetical protein